MDNSHGVPVEEVKKRGRPKKGAELTEEKTTDSDYNVEIIRDYYGRVDITYLSKKDPNYEYRFLREDPKNLKIKTGNLLFQKGGWQLTPRGHLLKLGIKEREIS